jgi:hypothetical protein
MRPHSLDEAVYNELQQIAASNVDRHLKIAQEWFPHDYVPLGVWPGLLRCRVTAGHGGDQVV